MGLDIYKYRLTNKPDGEIAYLVREDKIDESDKQILEFLKDYVSHYEDEVVDNDATKEKFKDLFEKLDSYKDTYRNVQIYNEDEELIRTYFIDDHDDKFFDEEIFGTLHGKSHDEVLGETIEEKDEERFLKKYGDRVIGKVEQKDVPKKKVKVYFIRGYEVDYQRKGMKNRFEKEYVFTKKDFEDLKQASEEDAPLRKWDFEEGKHFIWLWR